MPRSGKGNRVTSVTTLPISMRDLLPLSCRRIAFSVVAFLLLTAAMAQEKDVVYITKTGEKYHGSACRYLSHSRIEISRDDAIERGYTACSVCRPGTIAGVQGLASVGDSTVTRTSRPPSSSSQCTALTKAGSRCKRTTTESNSKCWQHQSQ